MHAVRTLLVALAGAIPAMSSTAPPRSSTRALPCLALVARRSLGSRRPGARTQGRPGVGAVPCSEMATRDRPGASRLRRDARLRAGRQLRQPTWTCRRGSGPRGDYRGRNRQVALPVRPGPGGLPGGACGPAGGVAWLSAARCADLVILTRPGYAPRLVRH